MQWWCYLPSVAQCQQSALLPALSSLKLARLKADFLPFLNKVPDPVAQVPRVHAGSKWLVGLVHRCAQLLQQAVNAPQLPPQADAKNGYQTCMTKSGICRSVSSCPASLTCIQPPSSNT